MTAALLDTHALVWLAQGDEQLGTESLELADRASKEDGLLVSAFSFWEVAMLVRRRRLNLTQPPASWRTTVLELGIIEIAISGEIGILAAELEDFHPDPADRVIAATAVARGATLITADRRILNWTSLLQRRDARI